MRSPRRTEPDARQRIIEAAMGLDKASSCAALTTALAKVCRLPDCFQVV